MKECAVEKVFWCNLTDTSLPVIQIDPVAVHIARPTVYDGWPARQILVPYPGITSQQFDLLVVSSYVSRNCY